MLDKNYNIEKSKALVWAKFNQFNAGELKVLDTYLSKIDARSPGSYRVTFTKREYCDLMGLHPETKTEQLKKYTKHLLGNVVTIDTEKGYRQYTLFTFAECELDEELGQNVVTICCNQELKELFFNLAEDGYVRYKLKNSIALGSQYSILLYGLLKDKIKTGTSKIALNSIEWRVDLKELREYLGATEKSYDAFKEFNRSILQKSQEEINRHTDINFEYEKILKGRLTRGIKFIITEKIEPRKLQMPGQIDLIPDEDPEKRKRLQLFIDVLPSSLTLDQVDVLQSLARDRVPFAFDGPTGMDLRVHDYLEEKVNLMKTQTKPVIPAAHYSWLRKAVIEDWK